MKWKIIYFDDDLSNIEAYTLMLEENFNVIGYTDAADYEAALQAHFPNAFLIDIHMPGVDGFRLYESIINHPVYNGCPIFFISGDHSDENILRSFERGGIDFLPRNISEEEIVMRFSNKIKLFLSMSPVIQLGNLKIDAGTFKVHIDQQSVDLTLLEMRILSTLLRSFPHPVSKKEMLEKIWGGDVVKSGTINTHLTNLRSKIEGWNFSIKVKDENVFVLRP